MIIGKKKKGTGFTLRSSNPLPSYLKEIKKIIDKMLLKEKF